MEAPIARLGALSRHLAPSTTTPRALKRAALSASDMRELSLKGWSRCESDFAQLNYLATAVAGRGEAVTVASLHKEGLEQGVNLLKSGENPYYRNMLLSPHADRNWLLSCSSDRLAAATNPPCLHNPDAPVLWGAEQWRAMQQQQSEEAIFDWQKVLQQFDRQAFERDGFCALRGVMTDEAARKWAEGLIRCQTLNDRLLTADWLSPEAGIDWEALGLPEPPPVSGLSDEAVAKAIGTTQAWPQSTDEAGVRSLRAHGVISEYFPIGHVPYLMQICTHPQMIALQQLCMATPRERQILFGQVNLNSKRAGYSGGGWHSHWTGGGTDGLGKPNLCTDPAEYMQQNLQTLNLTYPAGLPAVDGGGVRRG